jgi:N-acetylmuramoyl-L-alanine amidase
MTLQDYTVKGVGADMSEAAFLAVLRAASSPVSDGAARQVYSYCLARTLSPAYLLAMFHHESTYGRFGSAAETHSWGNTRPPSFGVPHLGVTERTFSKYANWVDGGVSTVARHFDYAPYLGKNTVRQIIPTWAPPIENSTERYIAAVLADIEKWVTPVQPSLDLTMREAIIPASNANRPGYAMVPEYITIHETSNTNPGADAEMHRKFVANGGGSEGVSFHWVVDDAEAIHLVPDDEVAWHAGDGATGPGNRKSIAIETCVNQGSDWGRTRRNLAVLTATLMHRHGIPLTNVVQHNFWSGKNCPLIIRRDGQWAGQIAATKVAHEGLSQGGQGGIYAAHAATWNGGIYAAAAALWA